MSEARRMAAAPVPAVRQQPRGAVGRRHARRAAPGPERILRAVAGLYGRLTWRGTAALSLAIAGYIALEIAGFRTAYPDGVSPLQFEMFKDNPAIRMMNGLPQGLESAGGFMVWDGGWLMQIIVAVWGVLTASRLLRGEEDVDRADLVLAAPIRGTVLTAVIVGVVAAESAVIGLTAVLALVVSGEAWLGASLFGAGLAGVAATFATATAILSQLADVRRRVAGLGIALLGVAYVIRMVGNSADSRLWIRWATPTGWIDELGPFGANDPVALVPAVAVPAVLGLVAVRLRAARDTGGALLVPESSGHSRLGLLSSPLAFAWRSTRGGLAGWAAGIAVVGTIMGALVGTMIDWLAGDAGYQQIFASMGLDEAVTSQGFVAFLNLAFCLAIGVYAIWRVGAAQAEEEAARLDAILARPVHRLRWLGGHVLIAALGAVVLTVIVGASMWSGVRASGSAALSLSDTMTSSLNTLPVTALVTGMAVALFGFAPRATVVVPTAFVLTGFVLYLLGPALNWPQWVLDLSPFTHLALVPAESWNAPASLVLCGIGAGLTLAGALRFQSRDLVPATGG